MQVILSKDAQKHFNHFPASDQLKIKKKLLTLQTSPYEGKKLGGELDVYRSLRAWPYRIIYQINEDLKSIEVSDIQHRQGAYK